jgi:hypothetical protein
MARNCSSASAADGRLDPGKLLDEYILVRFRQEFVRKVK